MASWIGYLVEEYLCLPSNYFRRLKRKSIVNIFVTFQEKIYLVWRNKKVLSLNIFDIKGAFNNVTPEVLALRF